MDGDLRSELTTMTDEITQNQAPGGASPSAYPSQWYALHVLSGQEGNVERHMLSRVKTEELGDYVHQIVIPTERIFEVKRGKKTEITRKLYPGYVFVNMYLLDEEKQLVDKTWYFVKDTPGVIGFANGDNPIPMRPAEVEGMLSQMREKEDKVAPKMLYVVGDRVRVGDGPFESQEGVIEEVDEDRGRVRVAVSIFGRSTPVELEFWQVEKI
ncbi:MAG: transcription termination/antitermination protein NusG [Candidatus Methylacidiphilales bacterium]|nr:transcription termination/antitermination protein NusG [Candidatus Methylacidiphilales bacterium]